MAGVLPANVSFFMSRLQGVSVSHFKIFPQTSQTAGANAIIRFELPSNSLINLRSLRMLFNAKMTSNGGRLPNKIDSLISRIAVYAGGVLLANNYDNYHLLRHAKDALLGDKCDAATGHPEIPRTKSYHNGKGDGADPLTAANAKEDYTTGIADGESQFCIDYWEGFLGTLEPGIIDTGLLPQITVEITLAENNVCPCCNNVSLGTAAQSSNFAAVNAAAPVYQLSNLSMQVEVLGMATSVLDQIVEQRIAQVGYVSLPFKNYFSYTSTHVSTTKFHVNSASWDRMFITYRPTTYADKAAPRAVAGYKIAGGFLSTATNTPVATATELDIGVPTYDAGGVLDTNKEKYLSRYFRMQLLKQDAASDAQFTFQINGATVPSFKCNTTEMYAITKNSLDTYHTNLHMTMNQYQSDYFVQAMRFCLPDSDFGRLASGLDTRSVSANATLETTNLLTAGVNVVIFAECTSELRVGSGRAIEVIQ